MEKKNIITIAGKLGSGKSSTAKRVSEILKYKHFSTGDFAREVAVQKGISLMDLNKMAESTNEIDFLIDGKSKEIAEMKNVVMDSRLGFYFIPESFKVFLDIPIDVSVQRILQDKKNNKNRLNEDSGNFETAEDIKSSILKRQESETKRYKDIYGLENVADKNNFNLIVDTSVLSLEEVSQKIVEEYVKWINS